MMTTLNILSERNEFLTLSEIQNTIEKEGKSAFEKKVYPNSISSGAYTAPVITDDTLIHVYVAKDVRETFGSITVLKDFRVIAKNPVGKEIEITFKEGQDFDKCNVFYF